MTGSTLPLVVQGEELHLHPERAVIWPTCRTVIVADTHFGKSGHFGRHGIAVPAGSEAADRERLNRLLVDTDARRLVILGDFLHAPLDDDDAEARDLRAWADNIAASVDIHVVAGNHDRGSSWQRPARLRWWETPWIDPPFRFLHDAQRAVASEHFTLSGHVHPVVRLRGVTKGTMRVPVFWQRATGLILPSFGMFTGGFAVTPAGGERVYAAGSGSVVQIGLRRRIPPAEPT